jgi:hypothetical protein
MPQADCSVAALVLFESPLPGGLMSSDPLPMPNILPEPPDDAEYEAFCAELSATERGRNFLTEYARRRRHPDGRLLAGNLGRLDAAGRDVLPPDVTAAFSSGFADLAAAIEQVAAVLGRSESSAANALFAAERAQDLVLGLRRRQAETALCDALETAIREMSDAIVGNDAAANRAASAAALLRDLARRVDDMIALVGARARPAAEPIVGENTAGNRSTSDAGGTANDAELLPGDDTDFSGWVTVPPSEARSVSIETVSMPSSVELPVDLRGEDIINRKVAVGDSSVHETIPAPEITAPNQAVLSEAEPASAATAPLAGDEIEGADSAGRFDDTARDSTEESAAEAVGGRAIAAIDAPLADELIGSLLEPAPLPSPLPDRAEPVDLDEDPADLFEPLPPPVQSPLRTQSREDASPVVAREAAAARVIASEIPALPASVPSPIEAETSAEPPPAALPLFPGNVSSSAPATSPTNANDPLAAVLALSDEELIALFG